MKRLARWVSLFFVVAAAAVTVTYRTVPDHTTDATHFDTLIVLGCPAEEDGSPSPYERERVMEAVREFRAGRSEHMIITGGSVHNRWSEADTMAHVAESAGVPADDIIVEEQARNTIENIFYSDSILRQHSWKTAEVISTESHLPRTALILERYHFGWRTRAARWPPEYGRVRSWPHFIYEGVGTTLLRWFGFRASPFLPASH